jgi:GNAT superfamily N-acetyltransferase
MAIDLRPGRAEDSFAVFRVFQDAAIELGQRLGVTAITGGDDPTVRATLWADRRSLFEHLASTASHFWIAETDGQVIGYARSTLRDGVLELTELFVLPQAQAAGVGRELLARAFPISVGERHRVVIATLDVRALIRYLKAGCYARFPIHHFARTARPAGTPTGLEVEPLEPAARTFALLAQVDESVLGFRRDADHAWLMTTRRGVFYRRDGRLVGYGYSAASNGPFAAFDEADLPLMLVEAEAAAPPGTTFGLDVPLINRVVVDYALAQGFRMGAFVNYFMSDVPFGRFEAYVCTTPAFFI